MIYKLIGKAVVSLGYTYAKRRYGRHIGIGAAAGAVVAVAAVGTAVYFSGRDLPEG